MLDNGENGKEGNNNNSGNQLSQAVKAQSGKLQPKNPKIGRHKRVKKVEPKQSITAFFSTTLAKVGQTIAEVGNSTINAIKHKLSSDSLDSGTAAAVLDASAQVQTSTKQPTKKAKPTAKVPYVVQDRRGGKRAGSGPKLKNAPPPTLAIHVAQKQVIVPAVSTAVPSSSSASLAAKSQQSVSEARTKFVAGTSALVFEQEELDLINAEPVVVDQKVVSDSHSSLAQTVQVVDQLQDTETEVDKTWSHNSDEEDGSSEASDFEVFPNQVPLGKLASTSSSSSSQSSLNKNVDDERVPDMPNDSIVKTYLKSIQQQSKDTNSSVHRNLVNGQLWVHPAQPSVQLLRQVKSSEFVRPDAFYYPKVFIFYPDISFPYAKICCPSCQKPSKSCGYSDTIRRVVGLDQCYYVLTKRYSCDDACERFVPTSDAVMSQFPLEIQLEYPCLMTKRSAADNQVVNMLLFGVDNSVGPSGMANLLREQHTRRHAELELQYYATARSLMASQSQSGYQLKFGEYRIVGADVIRFSSFDDQSGFAGFVPSDTYITTLLSLECGRLRHFMDADVKRRGGQFLKMDHSFKMTKHMQQINGQQLFAALFTVMNEYEEIRSQAFVQSTSSKFTEQQLINIRDTAVALKQDLPCHIWIDNCCDGRAQCERCFPEVAEGSQLPKQLQVPDEKKVFYINDLKTASLRLSSILVQYRHESKLVNVGFDLEWQLSAGFQKDGKVALLQLAFEDQSIYLFHLASMSTLPNLLIELLKNEKFQFIGRNISNDVRLLHEDYDCQVANVLELGTYCKEMAVTGDARDGLSKLLSSTTGYTLQKDIQSPRFSQWNKKTLSQEQRNYAALDAWASLLIYLKVSQRSTIYDATTNSMSPSSSSSSVQYSAYVVDESRKITGVHLDIFHAMDRIPIPKKHAFCSIFSRAFSDAIFDKYEEDVDTIKKFMLTQNDLKQLTFDQFFQMKRQWVLRRIRRRIPPPSILRQNIERLIKEFNQDSYKDPKSGKKLLDQEALRQFELLLKHVDTGCLSDVPDMQLYYALPNKDTNGLTLYRCIRGTSDVEGGVHQKIVSKLGSWNAGPQLADNTLAILRHRYNIRASVRHRPKFPDVGHYSHHLLDLIQKASADVLGKPAHSWWKTLTAYIATPEAFGILPCVPFEDQQAVDPDLLDGYTATMKFLAVKQKSNVPYLPVITPHERSLYLRSVVKYLPRNGGVDGIDYDQFAADWNSAKLSFRSGQNINPDGINIFKKLPYHLRCFMPDYLQLINTSSVQRTKQSSLQLLRESLNTTHKTNSIALVESAVAVQIAHPMDSVDAQEGIDSSSDTSSDEKLVEMEVESQLSNAVVGDVFPEMPISSVESLASTSHQAHLGTDAQPQNVQLVNTVANHKSKTVHDLVPAVDQVVVQKQISNRQNKQCKNCLRRKFDQPGCSGGSGRGQCYLLVQLGLPAKSIKSKHSKSPK